MRQGEICGLKWSDYNTITGDISVSRSMQRNFKLKDTKTKSSRRKIVLLKKTKLALDYQKRCQEENENLLGKQYINSGFICTHNNGESINPENLGKTFKKLIKEYKLEPIRFHDIRHSFATILLQNGTNPKIVSEILGHSDVQTTLNVYSHVLPDLQKDTMQQLEGILF